MKLIALLKKDGKLWLLDAACAQVWQSMCDLAYYILLLFEIIKTGKEHYMEIY